MDTPHASEVRQQVEHICHSPGFAAGERFCQLLRYVVEGTLKGEPATETKIALDVYKADPLIYHPSVDSIARVGKGKLIKKLRQFYSSSDGKHAPIEITIHGYEARFCYTGVRPAGLSFTNLREADTIYRKAIWHFIGTLHSLGFVSPQSNGYGRITCECKWNPVESLYGTVVPYDYVCFNELGVWEAIEFLGVKPDSRLSTEAQLFIKTQGFHRAILNHTDGIRTFYVLPSRGLRIKTVSEHEIAIDHDPDEPEYNILFRYKAIVGWDTTP